MKMRWWLLTAAGLSVAFMAAVPALQAQQRGAPGPGANEGRAAARDVTFAGDVLRILQENCQKCHRPNGVAPMSLMSYEEVRPWAPLIRYRTSLRDEAGAMPPYYLERNLGIQQMKDDERLTEEEIETIAAMEQVSVTDWNALVPADQPFLRHEFLHALEASEAVSAASGWTPRHLLVRSGSALAPLLCKLSQWLR